MALEIDAESGYELPIWAGTPLWISFKKAMTITKPALTKRYLISRIESRCEQRCYERHAWLCCFNVKIYRCDLDFYDLVRHVTGMGYEDMLHFQDPVWAAAVRERYEEHRAHLFDWGVEDARRVFVGDTVSGPCSCLVQGAPWYARMRPDGDTFRRTHSGKPIDARFAFLGRSGGWLVLTMFEGVTLDMEPEELLQHDYAWLRRLDRLIGDIEEVRRRRSQAVEEAAAYTFFANICHGCSKSPTPITTTEP